MTRSHGRLARRAALVGAGGAVGAIVRVWLEQVLDTVPTFPVGILVANLGGALVIGAALALVDRLAPSPGQRLRLLIATGFCGGLTTLSSLALAIAQTVSRGAWASAIGYGFVTIVGGLLAVLAGRLGVGAVLETRAQRRRFAGVEEVPDDV